MEQKIDEKVNRISEFVDFLDSIDNGSEEAVYKYFEESGLKCINIPGRFFDADEACVLFFDPDNVSEFDCLVLADDHGEASQSKAFRYRGDNGLKALFPVLSELRIDCA